MDVSKKRKRDVDCPRITYDATTKVFDRLFREESLEEMKNVVRKKFGLSPSLVVHLTQLRDGKSVVLEDDDDFDAFYASVHSTPITKIKVSFGDDQPTTTSTSGHDATAAGGPMQSLESPVVHHAAADSHSSSGKRKVTFVESISEPVRDNVEKPKKIQRKLALDESAQPPPDSEAPPEVLPEAPATIDVISADVEEAHETHDGTTKKRTQNRKGNKKKGSTLEVQSDMSVLEASGSNSKGSTKKAKGHVNVSGNTPNDSTKSKKRPRTSTADDSVQPATEVLVGTTTLGIDDTEDHPSSSKKLKHTHRDSEDLENAITDLTDDNQADPRTIGPEGPEHHIPPNGEADSLEVDVLTRLPKEKEMKTSRKQKEVVEIVITDKKSNAASSASKSKGKTSNSAIVVQHAKNSDPQSAVSLSGLETNSKGKTKTPGSDQSLSTYTKPTLNETQSEKGTISSASAGGKTMKKSRKKEAPVEPPKADSAQDQALSSDVMAATRAAVNAILARNSLPSRGRTETVTRSPLADAITSSLSATPIAPVISSTPPDDQPKLPNDANTATEQAKITSKCPICNQTPYHARSRCSIIKSGIRAMRRRIVELQQNTPEGDDEEREEVIEELRRIIDKRSRCKLPAAENKSSNVKSTADTPVISPTLVAESSRAIQSPRISNAVKPAEAPSQEVMPLPTLAESLAFGDISSYTVQDLEDLIRGPNVTLADVPSSDSSEEEEEVLEEEPEEVEDELSRSRSRIQYKSSSDEEEEEEDEEEASPFMSSIIPPPIKSVSELPNGDESFHSEDPRGDVISFHEVNGLGSSLEVDKTGDAAVNAAYALDFAHLGVPEISENGRKVVTDESQAPEKREPETVPDVVKPPTIATSQSDPIEASDKPESPQSPIVSIEEDNHFLQSTPKTEVAIRTRNQRNNSALVQQTAVKPNSTSQTSVNGINNSFKSAKKMGGLMRITDLPVPINPAVRVIKPAGVQTRRQATRAEEGEVKADEQGPNNASQAKQSNGKLSRKTAPNTTRILAKIAKTHAKTSSQASVLSNGENPKTQSVTVVRDVPEDMVSAPSNEEQSLASWAVLQGDSQPENETLGMLDELRSSPDTPDFPPSIRKPTFPAAVSKESDSSFLGSDSQPPFSYSQYTGFDQEPPGTEDEEDEVEASVVKSQTAIRSSSKFRSLTEIASQPTLFTPALRFSQTASAKDEVRNIYGGASKDLEEGSDDSDSESDSEAEVRAQTSHIPMSRRAGISVSKRGFYGS